MNNDNFVIQNGANPDNGFIVNKFLNMTTPDGKPIRLVIFNSDNLHPWFVGKDVGLALGYTDNTYRNGILDHVPQSEISSISMKEYYNSVSNKCNIPRGNPNTNIVSLPGVMFWAIRSQASNAEQFANWVIYGVLLSINNFHGYLTSDIIEQFKFNPSMINPYLEQMTNYCMMTDYIAKNSQYIIASRTLSSSDQDISINLLSNILQQLGYQTKEHNLYEELRNDGFLMKTKSDYNNPTQKAISLKVLKIVLNQEGIVTDEQIAPTYVTKVTPKGITYFINYYYKKMLAA